MRYDTLAPPEPKPEALLMIEILRRELARSDGVYQPILLDQICAADIEAELTRLQARVVELEADKWAKNVQLETMQARVVELERVIAAKDETLKIFAIRGYWAGTGINEAPKWIGGAPGNSEPWFIASAALNLKAEP